MIEPKEILGICGNSERIIIIIIIIQIYHC